ncbi:STAS domain-containing protein [Candidatus Hydrogenedentota bacterium]
MKIVKSQQGAITILSVSGPMIDEELTELDVFMDTCINSGTLRIVLELREVPFIDSAGLQKIQGIVTDIGKRGGDLRIAALNDICRDIFAATRMESFVQVSEDRESAVRGLL